jgi:beta-xylosidase
MGARQGPWLDDAAKWLKRVGLTHLRTGLSLADRFREDAWLVDRQMETLQNFHSAVTFCFTPEHLGLAPRLMSAPIDPNQIADFVLR